MNKTPNKKNVEIRELGEFHLCKNKNSKTMRLLLRPDRPPKVTMPFYASFRDAEKFIISKKQWIKENLQKLQEAHKVHKAQNIITDENDFRTKHHVLKIKTYRKKFCSYRIKDGVLEFFYPEILDIKHEMIQKALNKSIIETMRYEAKIHLVPKVDELSKKHGLNPKKVFVKNLKTRWGSCSSENNINLNLQLMRLPDELVDYVILHELAHIKEKNHGKSFWNLLETYITSPKALDRKLHRYRLENMNCV